MKGGRPAQFIGVRIRDLRVAFRSPAGHRRGFYARWRPNLGRWECQVSGFGMVARHWFASSQTLALGELRLIPCLWDWRRIVVDESREWDGIPDGGYCGPHGANPVALFPLAGQGGVFA